MIEPIWVNEADALRTHDFVLSLNGGASGVRDHNLLLSALARPRQHFAYATSPAIIDMAAALTAGVVKNHPFVDGNKRTGFFLGVLFLQINGQHFAATEDAAIEAVLALAAGEINEEQYAQFLRDTTTPSTPAQSPPPGA